MYSLQHNHINNMVVLREFSEYVTKSDAYFGEAESNSFTFDRLLTTAGVIYRDNDPCKNNILTIKVANHENPSPATKGSPAHSKTQPTREFTISNRRV